MYKLMTILVMHDRLSKHDSHTYNQLNGCVVDTW